MPSELKIEVHPDPQGLLLMGSLVLNAVLQRVILSSECRVKDSFLFTRSLRGRTLRATLQPSALSNEVTTENHP